ncbi:MAG: hypothetical protein ACO1RX_04290 [Candidatus Sericytochromatia bacterium]
MRLFWRVVGALSLSSLLAQAVAAEPLLLFGEGQSLRPIARYDTRSDRFSAPPVSPAEQVPVGAALLEGTRQVPLLLNGELRHYFPLQRFVPVAPGCTGHGLWESPGQQPALSFGLGFTPDFPGPREYIGSYPTSRFAAVAQTMTQASYRQHKVPAALLAHLRVQRVVPFVLYNGTRPFFAVESAVQQPGKDCPPYSQLLVVEQVGRRYVTRLDRFRRNAGSCAGYRLISSFATGPRIDKLVLQGRGDGAAWYDILQLPPSGEFVQLYHGGGHRCPLPRS